MKLSYTLLFLAGVQQKVLARLPTKLPTVLEANVCPVATAVNVETFDDTWETRRYIGLRELRNVLGNSVTTRVYQGKRKRPVTARSINCSRLRCGSRAPALDEPSCFFFLLTSRASNIEYRCHHATSTGNGMLRLGIMLSYRIAEPQAFRRPAVSALRTFAAQSAAHKHTNELHSFCTENGRPGYVYEWNYARWWNCCP